MQTIRPEKRRGYLGKFGEFCRECDHYQMVGVWKGRKTWKCVVCNRKNLLKSYDYYAWEVGIHGTTDSG